MPMPVSTAALLALVLGLPAEMQTSTASEATHARWTDHWAVSLSTGRSFSDSQPSDGPSGSVWQSSHRQSEIRLTLQGTPLVVGAALHRIAYPNGPDAYAIGAGLVFGAHHLLLSSLYAELDATVGLQRPRQVVIIYDGPNSMLQMGSLELYARLSAGVAVRLASWLEIPVRLTAHMHPIGQSHTLGAASVGLRCLLP
jgi:hypothetical protein